LNWSIKNQKNHQQSAIISNICISWSTIELLTNYKLKAFQDTTFEAKTNINEYHIDPAYWDNNEYWMKNSITTFWKVIPKMLYFKKPEHVGEWDSIVIKEIK
jgi:hypothetical protein